LAVARFACRTIHSIDTSLVSESIGKPAAVVWAEDARDGSGERCGVGGWVTRAQVAWSRAREAMRR
jgi:hypothetical protein